MRSRILFDEVPGGVEHLKPIVDAMRENRMLEITYQKFLDDEPSTFKLKPYCIKSYKQRWYVLGENSYDKRFKIKVYALDRIQCLSIAGEKFKLPPHFDANEYFYPLYGLVGGGEKPRVVKLKVIDEQRGYVRTLPLHHSQKEIETTDDYSIFSYFMVTSYELIYDLLAMEDMVEVIEPADFRAKVKEQVDAMYKLYKKK